MPAPVARERLWLTVLFLTTGPQYCMKIPPPYLATFPSILLFSMTAAEPPPQKMPPPIFFLALLPMIWLPTMVGAPPLQ